MGQQAAEILAALENGVNVYSVKVDGRAVGGALVFHERFVDPPGYKLTGVHIEREFRRRGYGRQLVMHIVRDYWGRKLHGVVEPMGDRTVSLTVLVRFYRSCGATVSRSCHLSWRWHRVSPELLREPGDRQLTGTVSLPGVVPQP